MITSRFVLLATLSPAAYAGVIGTRADSSVTLKIALAQKNFAGLEKALYAASTPGSESYGTYLTKSQMASYISPTEETVERVNSWLSSNGLSASSASPSGDWISVDATVEQANSLLKTDVLSFGLRGLEYTVPEEMKDCVVAVHPTGSALGTSRKPDPPTPWKDTVESNPVPATSRTASSLPESCQRDLEDGSPENFVKPYSVQCRFDLYDIPYTQATQPRELNDLWIADYTALNGMSLNEGPLRDYLAEWRPDVQVEEPLYEEILTAGGTNNQNSDHNMFTDPRAWMATSVAPNIPLTYHAVGIDGTTDEIDMMLTQANYLLEMESPPKVVAYPYSNKEGRYPREIAHRLCNAYAQLSARGVALIQPVGMGGVEAQFPTGSCEAFDVSFPASCPYVTSVGSTGVSNGIAELPPTDFGANAGGFSTHFERPAYQDAAVSAYLSNLEDVEYAHMYNTAGRANPDVSVHGLISPSVNTGIGFGSPAYAAGLFAGIIALLNDELVAAGKPTLGFLNPWIYENLDAFRDITEGGSEGCGTPGFNSTVGWDPVTGAGVPMYPRLRAAAGL
ncbi:Pro-kumamolisin, activation domain-containing protein [Pterulicium gracile]|uniref:Pro-kumamolisin, activation domain-containing protein n=1 Tax=Pterulicium gracile TaxID=1884261 RepID=A0A5C3QXM7_9AGAR|nr:Pro-kumamolisin, activation domain-containing protein [Pterula gracilis]